MKYIITVLMVIPMYYSISFANNLDIKYNSFVSGSISSTITNALEDEDCSNGSIDLEINNSNGPFYVEWSNGETTESIDFLIPGEYCVTVTDDLCGEATGCWEIKCCPFLLEDNQIQYEIINPGCEGQTGELKLELTGVDENAFPLSLYLENSSDFTKYDYKIFASNNNYIKLTEGNYNAQINYGAGCSNSFDFEIKFKSLEIVFDKTTSCDNDGTIAVIAFNGKLPYSYSWSDDPSINASYRKDLSPGFYKVTVEDAISCSASASVYIKNGDPIITDNMSVFIGPSDCFINTGVIELSSDPEGGSPPFLYEWSSGDFGKLIENLAGGKYDLTVTDDLGCSAVQSYFIPVKGQPIISNSEISNACIGQNNGELGILANSTVGGDLTYLWSNGSTDFILENLYTGSYTVTITDQLNNCSLIKTFIVEDLVSDPLVISETIINNCESEGSNNGEISLDISGGIKPYEVLWETGETTQTISNLAVGEYSAIITDKCGNIENFTANITTEQLNINIVVEHPNFEEIYLYADVDGGNGPYQYIWNTGNEASFLVEEEEGTYSVTVTDQNGCTKSETVDVICTPSDFDFLVTDDCYSSFKLKIKSDGVLGHGPFLVKVEKKINQYYTIVDFRQFDTQIELLNYTFIDSDLGSFKVTVSNYCGYSETEFFNTCVDCDYFFYNEGEKYYIDIMGGLLDFELVCPCSKDCGILGFTTDKVKLILNQSALDDFKNEISGSPTFLITWPEGTSNIYFSANSQDFEIFGPSQYVLSNDEFDDGIVISVSMSLPYGIGEVCDLNIPIKFGKEGINGYFSKWDNTGLNPFINYNPPYNWATVACPYKCKTPVVEGILYANEPIDSEDEVNYLLNCTDESIYLPQYFFYQPNDYTNPCRGGGSLLTHYESIIGVVPGQKTILPNVQLDAHPYWSYDMLEENDPAFPYSCPPHTVDKGYCLFDSRDVYGEDVILRDPIIASYCKERVYDPPVDTDGDGLPDVVDPCPLNPNIFCLNDDNDDGDDIQWNPGGGGGGGNDENGCEANFLEGGCTIAVACPNEDVTYIDGVVVTETYKGDTPCIHCFSAEVCKVTNPETGEVFSKIVGPLIGSVTFTTVDFPPECPGICGIKFTCTATGELIKIVCAPNCHTTDILVCADNELWSIAALLLEEGAPESITLEMTQEDMLNIYNLNRKIEPYNEIENNLITIPNPSKKDFIVQFDSQKGDTANLQISNAQSQIVLTKQLVIDKGINQFKIDNDLPSGIYFISININGKIVSTKHIIQN